MFRKQLPVYSPLSLNALRRASLRALGGSADAADRLRSHLEQAYGANTGLLCGSGTQALQLALRVAMAETANRHVLLPAFSCFDLVSAAVGADALIGFYDLDPGSLAPDLSSLQRELEGGARIVVAGPLYGVPVPWEETAELCDRYGAILIEDAAQGHGASWNGSPLGSLGRISTLSFGRGKGWTGGSGGAVLLRGGARKPADFALIHRPTPGAPFRPLVSLLAQWALGRPTTYAIPASLPFLALGETVYHEPVPPGPMSPLATLLVQENRAQSEREAEGRRRAGARWAATLPPALARIVPPSGSEPGFLRYPSRLTGGLRALREPARARALGVMPSYPLPLPQLPAAQPRLRSVQTSWPGALELVDTLITLPTHSRVSEQDRAEILRLLGEHLTTFPGTSHLQTEVIRTTRS